MASSKPLSLAGYIRLTHTLLGQFTVANPPKDTISAFKFSPNPGSMRLTVSSWDKTVYLYDLQHASAAPGGGGSLIGTFEHRAPVLDVCFGESDDEIYTAGLDWDVRKSVFALGCGLREAHECFFTSRRVAHT